MIYNFIDSLIEGKFQKRLNRFVCNVEVNGESRLCHVPNSGRMKELLLPETPVLLQKKQGKQRKTDFDLALVLYEGHWVSVDSRLPNKLFEILVKKSLLPETSVAYGAEFLRREPSYGRGRFDMELMSTNSDRILIELKSVTLVQNNLALFPDAPTDRGRRHLEELTDSLREGYQPAVIFLVQRDDALCFAPNWEMDEAFSKALVQAQEQGVAVESYAFKVTPEGLNYCQRLPVTTQREVE
ncbi:DNA/RNA nuclease SfsA [Natranaerobius thermophilus]|uniref:Sugar fermentation stimulation protein homolog n=1 Tax=Natranaerobius thermophilus (strain ATCC BAA-1301 / DSM 18059 / JW/NM-WN-LF) TaxID=457570 RepID=SFSA_NATTJ|nr:DNA/RNA nuclease SfsA [Natranaerobius thermophilus]B2A8L6.1 RecName: Full=Sugar fermentation stimulation protein homolog [Natranaerobius thermophilus JW/NM-WN-LF]ACB85900.1 sugar fermentation stimulation protein [Natranaerobius thermophilus JW/NM-WN-LF]